jgi:hypothetical protein
MDLYALTQDQQLLNSLMHVLKALIEKRYLVPFPRIAQSAMLVTVALNRVQMTNTNSAVLATTVILVHLLRLL